ncbi:MAG: RNA-splicing ligase RtcB [Deltaproteobacteria bacterium CG_4_9_14_3_um_filter_44_9]|nr:MAG: RNA-splicing ligase RtcB [Deltaproteobacteria bacterium CG2_30_43_15]PIU85997.1 MAG: RNA-splicing ligase RtcB [Deltaproteobacteria bacterium CG06_land_8_20_14_3_00_44_19]PIZ18887.1 MAG: RNA-splicing ligase RtcB [Deltaproteobacteria bacterium CG_4_10_14_0_8_um_filter_43_12]PJB41937.1 MAG: RNA-splicing ligase RtcB [Deltaproteobacteria bacterium CG_4_9_14_3_um_filter_44_9]HCX90088.1 RNA-splicing ligase RtcB [Deltaproteobacteria bacterium]
MKEEISIEIQKIDDYRWRIPKTGKMKTDGVVYTNEKMLRDIRNDQSLLQVANVAWLPGIVGYSLAMPDIHWGYGFPIGGVAAFDLHKGIISPGGVGYDINCGVRLMRSGLRRSDIKGKIDILVDALFANIPSGVGSRRKDMKLNREKERKVFLKGAKWAVEQGYGSVDDLEHIEERGCIPNADPDFVSERAMERGMNQLGTLGSGNHFVEIGFVSEIYDYKLASALGLEEEQVTVIVHTGSRGLGHQVCDDYIKIMLQASNKYGIELPDRQLCCAPVDSEEGRQYLGAMACAANYAFANRQMITHWVRETLEQVLKMGPKNLKLDLIYDVCHNIAKIEEHQISGKKRRLCVHRKGATRAFPPNHPDMPECYRGTGQPVLIPGDMGRYSYILVGTEKALEETFGSTCHGAGRVMSRHQAIKAAKGRAILKELKDQGIIVRSAGRATIVEEMSDAYKDVTDVVEVVHNAGISQKVAKLMPMGVIKG